jgi:hypothetical protein
MSAYSRSADIAERANRLLDLYVASSDQDRRDIFAAIDGACAVTAPQCNDSRAVALKARSLIMLWSAGSFADQYCS